MLYTKFRIMGPIVPGKKIYEGFLSFIGIAATLLM